MHLSGRFVHIFSSVSLSNGAGQISSGRAGLGNSRCVITLRHSSGDNVLRLRVSTGHISVSKGVGSDRGVNRETIVTTGVVGREQN